MCYIIILYNPPTIHCHLEGFKSDNFNPQGYIGNYRFSPRRSGWTFVHIPRMFDRHQHYDTNMLRHAQACHCQEQQQSESDKDQKDRMVFWGITLVLSEFYRYFDVGSI